MLRKRMTTDYPSPDFGPICSRSNSDSPAKDVTGHNAYKGRAVDTLSALFLLLAVLLAGGYGPQTVQASAPATSQSPSDLGTGGHRSVPFISKQQLLASETRDAKVAPWDDGKPKTFLATKGLDLAAPFNGVGNTPQPAAFFASIAASPYEARAPPVRS